MRPWVLLPMLAAPVIATLVVIACVGHSNIRRRRWQRLNRRVHVKGHRAEHAPGDEGHSTPVPVLSKETEYFLQEMDRRSDAVRNVCRETTSDVTREVVTTHLAAETKEGFLYCAVPHAPSGAWLASQLKEGGLWNPQLDEEGGLRKNPNPLPKDFKLERHEELFKTRILVTKHPLQRLLDCYTSKFENGKDLSYYRIYGKSMISLFRERPPDVSDLEMARLLDKVDDDPVREQTLGNLYANPIGPTFIEFVQYVVNSTFVDDVLWRPIHVHCAPCAIHYNFMLSFENLDEEGDHLMQVMQVSMKGKPKEYAIDVSMSTEATCSYYSQLSKQLLLDLIRKYYFEMRMFEYSNDLYLECADDYVSQ